MSGERKAGKTLPPMPTGVIPEDPCAVLTTWEHRLRLWNLNANAMSDSDMRALYLCGVSCAERIVRQLRADIRDMDQWQAK